MNQSTIPQIAESVITAVKGAFARSIEPIRTRLQALEERAAVPGKDGRDGIDGKDGRDGKDVAIDQVAALVTESVKGIVSTLPAPKEGKDGIDGKDGRPGRDFEPDLIEAAVQRRFEALPKPRDGSDGINGKDGSPGLNGKDGADGRDGQDVDPEVIAGVVVERVTHLLDDLPVPKDGKDGQDGKSVDPQEVEAMVLRRVEAIPRPQDGANGKDGAPGKDFDPDVLQEAVQRAVKALPPAEKGVDGKDGAPGRDGADGIAKDGKDGKDGEPGKDGKDADMVALRAYLGELVAEAIKTIPVPKDGEPGAKGEDGRDGREGEPGRDAPHVDVLDGIDEEKRYQRGVYAHFRGGLIRSFRPTDPVTDGIEKAGWHVIVEGDAEDDFELDERTLTVRKVKTSGRVIEKSFKIPVTIDRGLYSQGKSYEKGDAVTYGGAVWIAQEDTSISPSESKGEWRLAVKRGRDAPTRGFGSGPQ